MIAVEPNVFNAMQEFARAKHPNEIILLLRGEKKGKNIYITDFLHPPFGSGGKGYASFPSHMLPIDFSIIGTAHSHPSGNLRPSTGDLHNFYGRIMIIIGPPYSKTKAAAYTKRGEKVTLSITSHRR